MNTPETKKYFESQGIVALKADKTTSAPEIDQLLKNLGNETTQIPFYAIFPAEDRYKPQTYSGVFVSANHFLNKIQGVATRSSWQSPLLWVIVAVVGVGGILLLVRRRQPAQPDQ
ncbi:MAG: hypothetical protein GY888_14995 [Planctomycetaceae bacterium]|nr:hypothetical protein [Planctomycetaceae bacterium]